MPKKPITEDERWEAGADPTAFIDKHGMGRWQEVMKDTASLTGLKQAAKKSNSVTR